MKVGKWLFLGKFHVCSCTDCLRFNRGGNGEEEKSLVGPFKLKLGLLWNMSKCCLKQNNQVMEQLF